VISMWACVHIRPWQFFWREHKITSQFAIIPLPIAARASSSDVPYNSPIIPENEWAPRTPPLHPNIHTLSSALEAAQIVALQNMACLQTQSLSFLILYPKAEFLTPNIICLSLIPLLGMNTSSIQHYGYSPTVSPGQSVPVYNLITNFVTA
jgi:hypothetical protein